METINNIRLMKKIQKIFEKELSKHDTLLDLYGLKHKEKGYNEALIKYYKDREKRFSTFKEWADFKDVCYELSKIFEISSNEIKGILISKYNDIFVISTNFGLNHIELKN